MGGLLTTVLYTSQNSPRPVEEVKCDVPRSRNKVAIPWVCTIHESTPWFWGEYPRGGEPPAGDTMSYASDPLLVIGLVLRGKTPITSYIPNNQTAARV